jgi:hypothetical protein
MAKTYHAQISASLAKALAEEQRIQKNYDEAGADRWALGYDLGQAKAEAAVAREASAKDAKDYPTQLKTYEDELKAASDDIAKAEVAVQDCNAKADRRRVEQEQAERERQAAAQARAERTAKHSLDPHWMAPALSAALCLYQSNRTAYLHEIGEERRYGRKVSGFVDKQKLYNLGRWVRYADGAIADTRRQFAALKAKPMLCKTEMVEKIMACIALPEEMNDYGKKYAGLDCDTDEISQYTDIAPSVGPDDE